MSPFSRLSSLSFDDHIPLVRGKGVDIGRKSVSLLTRVPRPSESNVKTIRTTVIPPNTLVGEGSSCLLDRFKMFTINFRIDSRHSF